MCMIYYIEFQMTLQQNGIFNRSMNKYYRGTIRHFVVDKALCIEGRRKIEQ